MRRKYFIYFIATLSVLLTMGTGCKKYLDVNKNVNNPTPASVQLSMILSAAERNIAGNMALGTGLGSTMGIYTHQITGRVGADRYGAGAAGWEGLYGAISNLDVIIDRGTEESRFVYAGIAKILKAYTFSILVDVYGDVPFTEFDQFPEIKQPKFRDAYQKVAVNLLFTSNWLNYNYSGFFKEHDITTQQYNVLRILRGQYPQTCSLKLIKDRMLDRMSDASRIVDKLVLKGYVERNQCPEDRRSVNLLISEKGLQLLQKLEFIDNATNEIFKNLNQKQMETLNGLLDDLRG